jgi:hypothetical protein
MRAFIIAFGHRRHQARRRKTPICKPATVAGKASVLSHRSLSGLVLLRYREGAPCSNGEEIERALKYSDVMAALDTVIQEKAS